ncbi:hypothetical protein [Magnetospira sp. QH-2]|uniref:hypothetical protein n=1 Tax=Magnetospira sp. (strain QH-2) TaxID=1288970 RepID=UPI0003E8183E|nr:hypothetical protein [Magnetospira sp. QH-2]CCQ72743.1 conserved protein of unknown function [Magnetospira sp. QH-2]
MNIHGATSKGLVRTTCLLILLATSACSSFFDKPQRRPCAGASIPAELADFVIFDGPGRDLIDVNHTGRIREVETSCKFEIDEKTSEGTMSLAVAPVFELERGSANKDRQASFNYFIAVTEPGRKIRDKVTYPVTKEFTGNATRMVAKDKTITINLPVGPEIGGTAYHVYVGFQLDKAQVEFNRKRLNQLR